MEGIGRAAITTGLLFIFIGLLILFLHEYVVYPIQEALNVQMPDLTYTVGILLIYAGIAFLRIGTRSTSS